jgi:ankyrin repeat protein
MMGLAILLAAGLLLWSIRWSGQNDVVRTAILEDNLPLAQRLIRDPHAATNELFFAQSAEMAKLLISRGAPVDARNEYACTPPHFAAGRGGVAVVAVLLRRGVKASVRDSNDQTPLHWAVMEYHNVDTSFDDSIWPRTPVQKLEAAKLLLKHGANVNVRNASHTGTLEIVRLFLQHNADVDALDIQRKRPIDYAGNSHPELIELLRSNGPSTRPTEAQK